MQRPQNLNDAERIAKDVSKPPDIRKLARQVERTEQKKLDAPDKKGNELLLRKPTRPQPILGLGEVELTHYKQCTGVMFLELEPGVPKHL